MNINNFKISTKLTLGFGLMAVLLFLISATSLWKAKNLHDDFESVMHQQYPRACYELYRMMVRVVGRVQGCLVGPTPAM